VRPSRVRLLIINRKKYFLKLIKCEQKSCIMDRRNMVVIDIQGFNITNKKFIPKELTIFKNNKMAHYVFAPPFPSTLLPDDVQYQIKWLSKNHHCIKWDTGFVPHWKFQQILKKSNRRW
jgi:hypothetical protein